MLWQKLWELSVNYKTNPLSVIPFIFTLRVVCSLTSSSLADMYCLPCSLLFFVEPDFPPPGGRGGAINDIPSLQQGTLDVMVGQSD